MQVGTIRPFLDKLRRRLPSWPSAIAKRERQPQNVGWSESLAEVWFWRRCPGDAAKLHKYRLLRSRPLLFQINPKVDVLRVAGWFRFGNSVMQLRNVIYVAERWGARAIEASKSHPFFVGESAGPIALSWGVKKVGLAPTLQGRFFRLQEFDLSLSASDEARIFRDYVRPMVRPEFRIPDMRVRPDDLILHFRAGDVFTEEVHPGYGQPPLSYYLAAVEREQPARAWLVYEDRSNPCIDAAEAALRQRGIDVVLQSGTLDEDLRILMSARRIVAGRGTFVHMVSHLSDTLNRVYFFEWGQPASLRRLGIQVVKSTDAHGEFKAALLSRNWRNAPGQRALMLSYPADRLAFTLP